VLAPPEVASLVQAVGDALSPDEALSVQASQVLGRQAHVWVSQGKIVRVL